MPAICNESKLHHFKRLVKQMEEIRIVLYYRVSSMAQYTNQNMTHQREQLKEDIYKAAILKGRKAVSFYGECWDVCPGWKLDRASRPGLIKAVKLAIKYDALVVAINQSRFLRNKNYHKDGSEPTEEDYDNLEKIICGATIATVLNPMFTEDRSKDTKRGIMATKRKKNGREDMREKWEPVAQKMHDQGNTMGEIARFTGMSHRTISRWIRKYKLTKQKHEI